MVPYLLNVVYGLLLTAAVPWLLYQAVARASTAKASLPSSWLAPAPLGRPALLVVARRQRR